MRKTQPANWIRPTLSSDPWCCLQSSELTHGQHMEHARWLCTPHAVPAPAILGPYHTRHPLQPLWDHFVHGAHSSTHQSHTGSSSTSQSSGYTQHGPRAVKWLLHAVWPWSVGEAATCSTAPDQLPHGSGALEQNRGMRSVYSSCSRTRIRSAMWFRSIPRTSPPPLIRPAGLDVFDSPDIEKKKRNQ